MTTHRIAEVVDLALDRTVVGGFSRIGYSVRRRLPTWPSDPPAGSLAGKVAVVSGASSGLGRSTALGLAQLGAQVHLVVRNESKGQDAVGWLREQVGPDAQLRVWRCDIADLEDVRALTGNLAQSLPRIDVLVHNAGALPSARTTSPQGHEQTMAVHVLGPVLLTERLLPLLRGDEAPGRVVFVTSGGMYAQRLRADDPDYHDGDYSGTTAYARSKRAQVELLPVLARRWAPVDVYATHPGWVDTPGVSASLPGFRRVAGPVLRDAESGADTTVWLSAVSPAPASGTLWQDRHQRPTNFLSRTRTTEPERDRMWQWVADTVGIPT